MYRQQNVQGEVDGEEEDYGRKGGRGERRGRGEEEKVWMEFKP